MLHPKQILEDPISPISEMKPVKLLTLLPLLSEAVVILDTVQSAMSLPVPKPQSIPHVSPRPIIKNVITINFVVLKFVKEKVPSDS